MAAPVVIAGGGIFGATAAVVLARRGFGVTLVEAGRIPRPEAATTDIGKLVRPDYGNDDFFVDLALSAIARWREWNERASEPLFRATGLLVRSRGEMKPGSFEHDSYTRLRDRGVKVERLDDAEARRRFPAWAPGHADGYFNPEAGWAPSARVLELVVAEARALGVAVVEGAPVLAIDAPGGRVTGVRTDAGRIAAERVVVAAGAWTPALVPDLQDMIWPVAQPVLHVMPADPAPFRPPRFVPWCADIAASGWYGFAAMEDGRVKLAHHGAGLRVPPGTALDFDGALEARFRAFLRDTFPALGDAPVVERRFCWYDDSFDGDFLIDRHPSLDGLVVASGGSGHAFKFAPLLGDLIADAVEGRPPLPRFRWRDRGAARTEHARFTP